MAINDRAPFSQPNEPSRSTSPGPSRSQPPAFDFRVPSLETTPRYVQPASEAPAAPEDTPSVQPFNLVLRPGETTSRFLGSSSSATTHSRNNSAGDSWVFTSAVTPSPPAPASTSTAEPAGASQPPPRPIAMPVPRLGRAGRSPRSSSAGPSPSHTSSTSGSRIFTPSASTSPAYEVPRTDTQPRSTRSGSGRNTPPNILPSIESDPVIPSANPSTPQQIFSFQPTVAGTGKSRSLSSSKAPTSPRVSSIALSHSNTPSVSVTPPAEGPRSFISPSNAAAEGTPSLRQVASPERRQNDATSPETPTSALNMSGMAAALTDAANTQGQRPKNMAPLPLSPSPEPRRRRSGSAVTQIKYVVEDEEPPMFQRFFETSFQDAFGQAKNLMLEVRDVLQSSSLHEEPDSIMQQLHAKSLKLASFRCPSTRTVGFVGDSGVGKSSLLNSLLDRAGLARTGSSGAACTCAATEYHYHDRNDFRVEVILFSQDDIDNQVRDLLRAYRQFHRSRSSTAEQPANLEEEARIATDTFKSMFRGQLRDLSCLHEESEEDAQQRLHRLSTQARPTHLERPFTCDTLDECSQLLENLSSERLAAQEPAVWPYIKKIRVHLRAHILNRGLILVDLPGLRDLNRARLRITQRYLVEDCDEILAVCHIGRATTDEGVVSIIDLATEARLTKIGIVCTNSENIEAEETKRERPDQAASIQHYLDEIKSIEEEIDAVKESIEECYDSDSESNPHKDRENQLLRSLRRLQTQKLGKEMELQIHLIEGRNTQIVNRLRTQYGARVPGGPLGVHCVSNSYYKEHRNVSRERALPYINISGIPDLRRHCIGLVADSQLRDAVTYIQHDVPALVAQLELWIQNGAGTLSAEKRRAIRTMLDTVELNFQSILNNYTGPVRGLKTIANRSFDQYVFRDQQIDRWVQGAVNASNVWRGWHHSSYKAFCAKFGDHGTPSQPLQSWNHQAMEVMVQDLRVRWQTLYRDLRDRQQRLVDLVEDMGDNAVKQIGDHLPDDSEAITIVIGEAISSGQDLLRDDLEQCFEILRSGLTILETDALTGIRTSIFGNAMKSSYDRANCDSGSGSDQRRKAAIGGNLGREALFENHMSQFQATFRELTAEWHTNMTEALELRLGELASTFDMVREDNAAQEGDQDPQFRERLAERIRTVKAEMRRLQGAMSL